MQLFAVLLIALALSLPSGTSLADQTTAPGQIKKQEGAQSAKEYAPGQDKASEAQEKGDKAKAEKDKAEKATPDVGADKAKAKGSAKAKGTAKSPGKVGKKK